MAHYAELDANNYVIQVITGIDESQGDGEAIYQNVTGNVWKRTSFNSYGGVHKFGGTPFRKNYAGIGYTLDTTVVENGVIGVFYAPQPYPSWILDTQTYFWIAPTPMPTTGGPWSWDETTQSWVE
jgi:hypothetical protein